MLLDLINNFSKNYNFKKSAIQKIISDISDNEKQNIESIIRKTKFLKKFA